MIKTEAELGAHVSNPFDEQAKAALKKTMTQGDVIISTFPKCGTTWTGQIAHGIRSGGDMSFATLGEVMPWLEMGHFFGHDIEQKQAYQPALFKSHMQLSELPKGAKVISIVREPGDVLMSYYKFWSNTVFDPDCVSIEMLARRIFLEDHSDGPVNMFRLNYFQHLVDFHALDYDGPVLFMAYEDMKLNLPAAVRRISRFMDKTLSKTLERKVVEQSTFEFMSRHKEKFQELLPNGVMELVATGRVGDSERGLSDELKQMLDDAWQAYVTPQLGYRSYRELRSAISLD